MSTITATDAKNKFGQVLDQAQLEPVHIQKNGRDVAVVISAAEYQRLSAANSDPKVSDRVRQLLADSMEKRRSVYEALAK
jgi:prevent-host-death family protein